MITEWRMWAICCKDIGPISGLVYNTRKEAIHALPINYPCNPNYQIRRIKVSLDPEKRRG